MKDAEVIQLDAFRGKPGKFYPVKVVVSDKQETRRERKMRERQERQEQEPKTGRSNMHTFLFRSYDLIVQADDADLVRDVCRDIDKAQTKLKAVRRRLKGVQEQTAAQLELLTTADTKLSAAIVVALLSTKGGNGNA